MKIRITNRDLYLRLLSLLIAIIFWLFAKQNVQIPNITQREQYQKIMRTVVFTDVDEGIFITSPAPQVFLEVSGPYWEITQNKDQIVAYASLKNRRSGKHHLDIEVRVPEGVNVIQYFPEAIDVQLEGLLNREMAIEPLLTGSLSEKELLRNITLEPDTVTVFGPDSLIKQAFSATVLVDLGKLRRGSHQIELPIQIRSANGVSVSGLELNPRHVGVNIEIDEEVIHLVPIVLDLEDEIPDPDAWEITLNPDMVYVMGDLKIDSVMTEKLSFDELPFTGTISLLAPSDAEIWPKVVEVTILKEDKGEEE